jgi:hypothetical protein
MPTGREVVTGKENTQKIEKNRLSLRTWCSRLVRKGIRFSKDLRMHKIVAALVINFWFFQRIIWRTTCFAHYRFSRMSAVRVFHNPWNLWTTG